MGLRYAVYFTNRPNWFQLFRRVAAALPGMDSTENKPPEDSILLVVFFILLLSVSQGDGDSRETEDVTILHRSTLLST